MRCYSILFHSGDIYHEKIEGKSRDNDKKMRNFHYVNPGVTKIARGKFDTFRLNQVTRRLNNDGDFLTENQSKVLIIDANALIAHSTEQ